MTSAERAEWALCVPIGSSKMRVDIVAREIDAAVEEATDSRDHEIAVLMREVEALKEKIEDMRHDAMERGER